MVVQVETSSWVDVSVLLGTCLMCTMVNMYSVPKRLWISVSVAQSSLSLLVVHISCSLLARR